MIYFQTAIVVYTCWVEFSSRLSGETVSENGLRRALARSSAPFKIPRAHSPFASHSLRLGNPTAVAHTRVHPGDLLSLPRDREPQWPEATRVTRPPSDVARPTVGLRFLARWLFRADSVLPWRAPSSTHLREIDEQTRQGPQSQGAVREQSSSPPFSP